MLTVEPLKETAFARQNSDVIEATRDADRQIIELTKEVKERIERREGSSFKLFGAISYYYEVTWQDEHNSVIDFWIKVRYDDGIMHVNVLEVLHHLGGIERSVMNYRTGKTLEEALIPF